MDSIEYDEHWLEILEPVCMPAYEQLNEFCNDGCRWLWEQIEFPTMTTFQFKVKIKTDDNGKPTYEKNWVEAV
jgi:hypothetical protein